MNCPNCGHRQPDGTLECQSCQIIFSKWKPREPRLPLPGEVPRPAYISPDAVPPRRLIIDRVVLGALAGMLLCGLALWWFLVPPAGSVPEDAYVNRQHRFALSPPPEWIMLTRENMGELVKEHGDRLPSKLRGMVADNKNIAVSFVMLEDSRRGLAPSFNVVVIPGSMPRLREDLKEEATRELGKAYASVLEDYRQESIGFTVVDGLEALEIVSIGSLEFKVADAQYMEVENAWGGTSREKVSEAEFARPSLQFRQVLVPGRKRAYVVTFTALEKRWDEMDPAFQRVLGSFRVLQRPPRLGPILNGAVVGGLIGAILGFMGMIIKRMGGSAEQDSPAPPPATR